MLHASVFQQLFDIENTNGEILVDGQPFDWDCVEVKPGLFHILHEGRSYTAEVLSADRETKSFSVKINGHTYPVQVKDRFDRLLDQLGMGGAASRKPNDIKAPMPGLIVEIRVVPGQVLQKGDTVLILEAMKMENSLKAPADATVRALRVALRDNVEKNQVLVEFE